MNFDNKIYPCIFQRMGNAHNPFKVTLYLTHRDEDARIFRAHQIIKITTALSDGPFQILAGVYQEAVLDEEGNLTDYSTYTLYNLLNVPLD